MDISTLTLSINGAALLSGAVFVVKSLHELDKRLAVIETTLDYIKKNAEGKR